MLKCNIQIYIQIDNLLIVNAKEVYSHRKK